MNTELSLHADDCECRTCNVHRVMARGSRLGDHIYDNTDIVDSLKPAKCIVIPFPSNRTKARGEL